MPVFPSESRWRSHALRGNTRAHLARLRKERIQKRLAAGAQARDPARAHAVVSSPHQGAWEIAGTGSTVPSRVRAVDLASDATLPSTTAEEESRGIGHEAPDSALDRFRQAVAAQDAPEDETKVPDATTEWPGRRPSEGDAPDTSHGPGRAGEPGESGAGNDIPDKAATEPELPRGDVEAARTQTPSDPAEAVPQPLQGPGQMPEPSSPHDLNSETDLSELPGAGPGLIWLFGECGIKSLADLAEADTAFLSRRLGLIGELLDLEHWRDFAKARMTSV